MIFVLKYVVFKLFISCCFSGIFSGCERFSIVVFCVFMG